MHMTAFMKHTDNRRRKMARTSGNDKHGENTRNSHRSDLLDGCLGCMVEITLFDGEVRRGQLGYAEELSEKYGFRKPGMYYLGNLSFYKKHIKSIKKI